MAVYGGTWALGRVVFGAGEAPNVLRFVSVAVTGVDKASSTGVDLLTSPLGVGVAALGGGGAGTCTGSSIRGRPSPALAQLTLESICLSISATGDAMLLGGKIPDLHVGHVYPAGAVLAGSF